MPKVNTDLSRPSFIIAKRNRHNDGYHKVGFVFYGQRLRPDAEVTSEFNGKKSGRYQELLKSCRFLIAEETAVEVEWEVQKLRGYEDPKRYMTIKLRYDD